MSQFSFRWWYFLLLVPILGYLGARLYVDSRIQSAITAANTDNNQLAVGSYSFSLFPLGIAMDSVVFDQDREKFSASGRVGSAALRGISLTDLLRGGRLGLGSLRVAGLDAEITRKAVGSTGTTSGRDIQLDRIQLENSRLRLVDPGGGRSLLASDLTLDHLNFRTPFSPAQLERTNLSLDSLLYAEQASGLRVLARQPVLDREIPGLRCQRILAERTAGTTRFDLTAEGFELRQPNFDTLAGGQLLADRLSAATLRGRIEVDSTSGPGGQPEGTILRLAEVSFPLIDLEVSAPSGRAVVRGGEWEQAAIAYPLTGEPPGSSRVKADSLHFRNQKLDLALGALAYNSESGELRTASGSVDLTDGRSGINWDKLLITGVPRNALLLNDTAVVGKIVLEGLRGSHRTRERSRFDLFAATVVARELRLGEAPRLAGISTEKTWLKRYDPAGRLRLHVTGMSGEQGALNLESPKERPGPTRLSATQVLLVDEDGSADYRFEGLDYRSTDGRLTLDSLLRRSARPLHELLRTGDQKSILEFSLGGLTLEGIDRSGLLHQRVGRVAAVSGRSFSLRVVEDPSRPRPSRYRPLPMEALRKLPFPLRIDRIQLAGSRIEYAVVGEVFEPKTIVFSKGKISVRDLDTRVSATDSVEVTLACSFQDSVPLSARFALSRSASGRNYGMSGRLGVYNLTDINPLMDVAANVNIESGILRQLSYRADMRDDTLSGDMAFLYEELDVSPQGALGFFKDLAADIVVKGSNQKGEDFRPGIIYFESDETRAFFNAYWQGLVAGMKSSALGNIALPDKLENKK